MIKEIKVKKIINKPILTELVEYQTSDNQIFLNKAFAVIHEKYLDKITKFDKKYNLISIKLNQMLIYFMKVVDINNSFFNDLLERFPTIDLITIKRKIKPGIVGIHINDTGDCNHTTILDIEKEIKERENELLNLKTICIKLM